MSLLATRVRANVKRRLRKNKPLKVYSYKRELKKDWLELISRYEYDFFATLTFREDTERWLAEKKFEKWLGSLNNMLFGWRYKQRGRGIRYAVAFEHQKRGALHFHDL